jgi:hypothetical protein
MATNGITVNLKCKKLKSGKSSYYLQYYNPLSRIRHKEYLGLYLIPKPKNEWEREHNKQTKKIAESVYSKRLLEVQIQNHDIKPQKIRHITLLSYYETQMEKKKSSPKNYPNWRSSLKHLKKFSR